MFGDDGERPGIYIGDVSHVQPLPKDNTGGPRISDIRLVTTRTFVHYNSHPPLIRLFPPLWRCGPTRAMVSSSLRLLDHTTTHQ